MLCLMTNQLPKKEKNYTEYTCSQIRPGKELKNGTNYVVIALHETLVLCIKMATVHWILSTLKLHMH